MLGGLVDKAERLKYTAVSTHERFERENVLCRSDGQNGRRPPRHNGGSVNAPVRNWEEQPQVSIHFTGDAS